MNFLQRILEFKKQEVAKAKKRGPLPAFAGQSSPAPRRFSGALRQKDKIALIAEIKKASPSKGLIRPDFDPAEIARAYEKNGAHAISVLTDEKYFQGSLKDLRAVYEAVDLPLLRKDFILDAFQVQEAKAAGASAVLLIAAALDAALLSDLRAQAEELGMEALVEVHDEKDLKMALAAKAGIIGINNRDLETFQTDPRVTARLLPHIPPHVTVVSESGIHRREQILELKELGVHAVLIGEAFMASPDISAKIKELFP